MILNITKEVVARVPWGAPNKAPNGAGYLEDNIYGAIRSQLTG